VKAFHLTAVTTAMCALLALAPGPAGAQQRSIIAPPRNSPPPPQGRMHGFRHFSPGFFIDREYVPVYVHDDARDDTSATPPAAVPPPPPPAPRKPYVIGRSYSSLPGGCLKLIQDGSSYYGCSGEWYRQAGDGAGYKAVAQP
jgi:hypothetical protein